MSMTNKLFEDEVEDDYHKDDPADHLMFLVGLVQMSLMEMSIGHLEVHEGLDDPNAEEEGMTRNIVMLSSPMMTMSVKMDRSSWLLPEDDDGPQACCALLPCEIGWVIRCFQS